jgi:hypothetical protein
MFFSIFDFGKRKKERDLREREQAKRIKRTERNLTKSAAINTQAIDVLNQSILNSNGIRQGIDAFNNQVATFQETVNENQRLNEELQQQQSRLSSWEEDLKDRKEAVRKEEITIHLRSESVRKDEERVAIKDAGLDAERQNIKDERAAMKDRVAKAEKAEKEYMAEKDSFLEKQREADEQKRAYEDKIRNLESREEKCKADEESIASRLAELGKKEASFSSTEKAMRESLEAEKERWEKDRAEIENNLNEKIKEYDRKLADMEAMSETFDNIKYDDSEDGKRAKIVVKEAIRVSIKTTEEMLQQLKEIDEKYASGTFKGFSVPIDEINLCYEELKTQYAAIKEHAESTDLDFSVWLGKIENCVLEADKYLKSFFFAESYRNIVEGLSYCKGYEDIITILNNYAGASESSDGEPSDTSDGWIDLYKVLFDGDYDEAVDYTEFDIKQLKKQYRKMAKKYHPDKAAEDNREEYTERFKQLNEAWDILSDADKRANYDSTYVASRDSHKTREK